MKNLSRVLIAVVSIFGVIGSASACPVATSVVAVQAVAAPVVVAAEPVVVQAPLVYPGTVTIAVPTVALQTTPIVIEQVVKLKSHRAFRTPVRNLLFR